ncbi:Flavoprotein wrbA [Flexistipes sinusarabici DSM 4947]|uniref:NAD(P)H dehydrogenase (quinone) n=1 Tax=Flexistipes sinusarabici (strain ATCC 49648 / DSM 4947 / MAS 10) TaxID=717231 RepID=F8E3Y2_FLESM|nr:NAD(P)H:quinone oxidoreductase [Flexistipes sinusarabici]AEI15484.1 Flavoprotein wrbA [Flexistipes sinusarabici DSM 4947]
MTTVYVVFYSLYGHVYRMAEEVVKGVKEVENVEVKLFQVPELMSNEQIEAAGAKEAKESFAHVPVIEPDMLAEADGIIFGTPTRYGNMASQMKNFLDQTGSLWMNGALVGKVGSVFASTATQHGGQETTLTSFHTVLFHHGMIVAGVPYSCGELMNMDEITGGAPYGATTLANTDGSRQPTENELAIARFQGKHVAGITKKLHS